MAIWQFQCNIVPTKNNIEKLSRDEIISWEDVSRPIYDIDFLEKEKSWSRNIVQYGKSDETCVEFFYANNLLREIECRLDLRSLTKQKFVLLLDYVQKIGALFFVEDMIYPPKIEIMVEVMKHSEANRFCKSPIEYFLSLNSTDLMMM